MKDRIHWVYISKGIAIILALIGSIFVIDLSMAIVNNSLFEYLGRHSLPIYVLQGIVIAATRVRPTKLRLNIFCWVFPLLVCTFSGCFSCFVFIRLAQKYGN